MQAPLKFFVDVSAGSAKRWLNTSNHCGEDVRNLKTIIDALRTTPMAIEMIANAKCYLERRGKIPRATVD